MPAARPILSHWPKPMGPDLKGASLTDWPGVLALASEAASAVGGNKPRLIGLPMLLLDVPIGNDAEFVFVDTLAAAATEVLATVPTADQPTLRRLRNRLRAQIDDLDQGSVDDQSTASSTSASALTNLQRRLFKEEEKLKEATPDNTVEVFSAPGEGRECVEIARRVVSMARSGVALDRIAVLLKSPEGYRTYLEEAFNRAGFPALFARGAVRPDPAGRAFAHFSSARPGAIQRGDSQSTFHSDRFRMLRPMAPLPKRFLAANAGYPPTPSLLNPRPRKPLKSSNPHSSQRTKPMKLLSGKDS